MFGDKLQRYERSFEEGNQIFEEGDWGDAVFIVKEGTVEIIKENNNNTEMHVADIGPGEIVGELVLGSSDSIRTATVIAKTDVVGLKIRTQKINKLLSQSSDFREKFIKTITKRLKKTNQKLARKIDIERELFEVSFLLLSLIDEEDWMNDDSEKLTFTMDKEPEFLAYKFGASLEKIEQFLIHPAKADLDSMEDTKLKQQLGEIAKRIIDKGREKIKIEVPLMEKIAKTDECVGDEILLRGIRKADEDIEKLTNQDQSFDREDYQDIKSDLEDFELIYDKIDSSRKDESFIVKDFKSRIDEIEERLSNIKISASN